MKIGLMEILVILFVAFSALLMFRLFRGEKPLKQQGADNSIQVVTGQELAPGNNQLKKAGVILVVLGIVALIFGMRTFEFVMKMYFWAFILVAAGLVALVLSKRR